MKKVLSLLFLLSQAVALSQNSNSKTALKTTQNQAFDSSTVTSTPTWVTPVGSLDMTIQCNDPGGLAMAQSLFPSATNACDANGVTIQKTSEPFIPGPCSSTGVYVNTWVATDYCGDSSMVFTQQITVMDFTAPVWTTPPGYLDATLDSNDTAALALAQAAVPSAVDNCSNVVVEKVSQPFALNSSGTIGFYTNTWSATDDCGNSTVSDQTITVNNVTPAPDGASQQTLAEGSTLADIILAGDDIQWYDAATNTTTNKSTNSSLLPSSTVLVDGTTYYASQKQNGFESTQRLPVTVTLTPLGVDTFKSNQITLSPNPTHSNLNLQLNNNKVADKITITNLSGKTILTLTNTNKVNVENLAAGAYLLQAQSGKEKYQSKFIKQ
jgi:Secretion system C-terminal sorting domain/Ig-like domain CHU_C associated